MECLNSTFTTFPDENLVQGGNAGAMSRERSFQIKQYSTSFSVSVDDITCSTQFCVQDTFQVFHGGNSWDCLGFGWVMGRKAVSVKIVGVYNGELLAFDGVGV